MVQSLRCASAGVAPNNQQKQRSLDQYTYAPWDLQLKKLYERQYTARFDKTLPIIVFIYLEETLSFTTH